MNEQPEVNACRACGAAVYWATNTTTGKSAPIDADPSTRGNIYLFRKGENRAKFYRVLNIHQIEDAIGSNIPLHTNHFMTCPNASEFKKEKR